MNHLRFSILSVSLTVIFSCIKTKELPTLTTTVPTNPTINSVTGGGNITNSGGADITSRGVCWSTSQNPTISGSHTSDGEGTGSFISNITGLSPGIKYYIRAYAANSLGTAYGNQESFTTAFIGFNPNLTYGEVSDIDGNTYKTIQIGTQIWMAENLRTSKYNDGSPIPNIIEDSLWSSTMTYTIDPESGIRVYQGPGAFCWYSNDSADYENDYGKLYNFFAASSGKLCPIGWHVATFPEWQMLVDPYSISIEDIAGAELMETGTYHWNRLDIPGTNETGFTALPGGSRQAGGSFSNINLKSFYWQPLPSGVSQNYATFYPIPINGSYNRSPSMQILLKGEGLSVRCIKD